MEELQQISLNANSLRKAKKFKDALPLYKELYDMETKNKFDITGYLHCLRKLGLLDDALQVAEVCEKLSLNSIGVVEK